MSTIRRTFIQLFLVTILSTYTVVWGGQSSAIASGALDSRIAHFDLVDQTLSDGLTKLRSEPLRLSFGFESVLRERFADPPIPDPRFSLHLENSSFREILDALCRMDVRYTWSQDGATINVYPWPNIGDSSYLLNRKLVKLEIKSITDIQYGLLAIVQQLPPPKEQVAIAQIGVGFLSYPPEAWSATFEDVTVRQAINRLAIHGGPRSYWHFGGSKEFRAFSFWNAGITTSE
jgi:hypothetical protein